MSHDEPVNWAGRTFGELTADEKRRAAKTAGEQLSAELAANADAISAILDDAEPVPVLYDIYVCNVDRQPGKTTYLLARDIGGHPANWGRVIVRPGSRVHLDSKGEAVASPSAIAARDAAVDHYEGWAAQHS